VLHGLLAFAQRHVDIFVLVGCWLRHWTRGLAISTLGTTVAEICKACLENERLSLWIVDRRSGTFGRLRVRAVGIAGLGILVQDGAP
jgi:hypothetical protein